MAIVAPAWILLVCIAFAQAAHAAPRNAFEYSRDLNTRPYVDVQFALQGVRHSELDFYPTATQLSAGFWIFNDIGIDFFIDRPVSSDKESIFDVEIRQASGVALRFQSPHLATRLHAYMLLGYVDLQVEQNQADDRGTRRIRQSFSGARISIGFARRLSRLDNVLITGEYRNYYTEDEIQIDGIGLGLRVNLR